MLRYFAPVALFLVGQTALAAAPEVPSPREPERSEASSRGDRGKSSGRSGGAKRARPASGSHSASQGGGQRGDSSGGQRDQRGSQGSQQGSQGSHGSQGSQGSQGGSHGSGQGGSPEGGRGSEDGRIDGAARPTGAPGGSQVRPVQAGGSLQRGGPSAGAVQASAIRPGATRPGEGRAPANFRAPAGGSAGARASGPSGGHDPAGPPPGARAAATAGQHRSAAAAHRGAPDGRRGAYEHHRAWNHRYRAHHPFRWGRAPVFVTWYPGHRHYWYHGVFVYGPPPGAPADAERGPKRQVNHAGEFAVGVRGGTYASGYTNGSSFSDFGLGLAARYRIVDPLGVEVQWTYHDQSWQEGTERIDAPLSASAQLFALPWTKVNPYVSVGFTRTERNIQDTVGGQLVDQDIAVWGPHAGIGLELGLSKKTTLNLDLRGIGYLNDPAGDLTRQGATQANLGVNFYF